MGGEKVAAHSLKAHLLGSPPHRRGKGAGNGDLRLHDGITPAWAGKSWERTLPPSEPKDHPRACGEKNKELEGVWLPMRSPPRGRGKVDCFRSCFVQKGITPAWAGKRKVKIAYGNLARDHPRMGGEKIAMMRTLMGILGSPPRRRGKADKDDVSGLDLGITPAGRGKELVPTRGFGFKRITPAWAGKRFWNRPWVWATSDHPRVGGEKLVVTGFPGTWIGSPPRGRGKG